MKKINVVFIFCSILSISLYATCIFEEEVDVRSTATPIVVEQNTTGDIEVIFKREIEIPCAETNLTR